MLATVAAAVGSRLGESKERMTWWGDLTGEQRRGCASEHERVALLELGPET